MNKKFRTQGTFPAFIGIALVMVFGLVLSAGGEQERPLAERKDPVVLTGKQLPAKALGAKIDSYRLFASSGGSLAPIPYQIDRFDKDGKILPKTGPKAAPDWNSATFGATDQLALMAHDMGKQSVTPKVEGCSDPVEITATDAKSGAKGYAYLFRCTNPPPPSKTRYVRYDASKRTVITDYYRLGWQEKLEYYYDYISINNGPDILDRLKIRITVGLGKLRKTFSEENFLPTFYGVNDGPVRVVYRCDNMIDLGILKKLPIGQNLFFYDTWAFFKSPLDSRFNPAILGLDFDVAIELDMALQRSRGYKLCSETTPDCPAIDGVMTDAKRDLAKKQLHWGGIVGPEGAHIIRFMADPRLPTKTMGYFMDDDKYKDPPEYIPGSSPVIGFDVVNWKNAKPGIYDLDFYLFFMKQYSEKEFKIYDKVALEKLKVEAK